MKIVNVVGARPNFVKIAPLLREMRRHNDITPILIHTGQHYDISMAGQFFRELQIPQPDVSLEVGAGSQAYQTAEVMKRIEPALERLQPDLMVVVGDVNSTLAAALTGAKLQIPIAHVEAGLRSFDKAMPEEINRVLTDAVSDYLFVTEESGRQNLLREGVAASKIYFAGNVMIDALNQSRSLWREATIHARLGIGKGEYGVVTLHRPSNVDDPQVLRGLLSALVEIAKELPLIFPVHPRTRKQLATLNGLSTPQSSESERRPVRNLYCVDPLGYVDFVALTAAARLVLTDSGGLQEETTALGVPCMTLREKTERPVTVECGTNHIVGTCPARIIETARYLLHTSDLSFATPPLWDGKASERIVAVLCQHKKPSV